MVHPEGDRLGVEVERMLCMTGGTGEEHLVTPFGSFDEHGSCDRHQDSRERTALIVDEELLVAIPRDAVAREGMEVVLQELVFVNASKLGGETAAHEIGDVVGRGAPGGGLPIHHEG